MPCLFVILYKKIVMKYDEQNEMAELIFLYYIGKISKEQKRKLDDWLNASPEHVVLFEFIVNSGRIYDKQNVLTLFNQQLAWKKVAARTIKKHRRYVLTIVRYAALIILLLGFGVYYWKFVQHDDTPCLVLSVPFEARAVLEYGTQKLALVDKQLTVKEHELFLQKSLVIDTVTITVPRGGEFQLTLEDGTNIWLNSGTKLQFPRHFAEKQREVTLIYGEVYFNVAKDTARPFKLYNTGISLEVLGTEFNVKSYPEEVAVATTLVNGAVSLDGQTLKPGQQAVYDKESKNILIRNVDTRLYTSWKEGRFIFKSEPLEIILNQLSRWYNVVFEYEMPELKTIPFSGNVRKYEDGNIILDILMTTGKVRFERYGDIVYVKSR